MIASPAAGPVTLTVWGDGQPLATAAIPTSLGGANAWTLLLGNDPSQPRLVGALDGVSVRFEAAAGFPYATSRAAAQPGAEAMPASARPIALYRLLQPWLQGSGAPSASPPTSAPANWTARGGSAWGSPGAAAASDAATDLGAFDRARTPLGSLVWSGANAWYSVDITDAAAHWSDGSWAQSGLLLQALDESTPLQHLAFASAEAVDPTQRPRVTVRYVPSPAAPVTVDIPAVAATWIASAQPTTSYAGSTLLTVESLPVNGAVDDARALLRFDTTAVPAGKTVISAQLFLTRASDAGATPDFVSVRRLLVPFQPGQATWLTSGLASWSQPGAAGSSVDRAEGPLVSSWGPFGAAAVDAWSLTAMAQAWIDQPASNYGVILQVDDPGVNAGAYYDSIGTVAPPRLRVQYLP